MSCPDEARQKEERTAVTEQTSTEETAPQIIPGTVLADRYEVVRSIGRGEFGEVYEVIDRLLGTTRVGLKLFTGAPTADPRAAVRFGQEILSMTRVRHTNVVSFFDVVKDGNHIGYTMELVRGASLGALIEKGPRFTPFEIRSILHQICRGTAAIHQQHVIHRDLKPENVIVTEYGVCKIVDFGAAYILGDASKLFTKNIELWEEDRYSIIGTLDYISPEMLLGQELGPTSDVFSIGVLGYLMFAGEPPFADLSAEELMIAKVQREASRPAPMGGSGWSERLSEIIMKAIARSPDQRYATPLEMAAALEELEQMHDDDDDGVPTARIGHRVGQCLGSGTRTQVTAQQKKRRPLRATAPSYAGQERLEVPKRNRYGSSPRTKESPAAKPLAERLPFDWPPSRGVVLAAVIVIDLIIALLYFS